MKKKLISAVIAASIVLPCLAQQEKKSLVWTDPDDKYASYLEAAVQKKHTPVEFTTDKSKAEYMPALSEYAQKGSTARAIFLGPASSGARSELSLSVSDAKTGNVVFSYTCQKNGEGGSFQSAAECLAKHWSHFLESGKP
jgi:hypothetical protein